LQTLLPHSNSANHQEQGVWIHIAPAITGDVQTWYNASGFDGDWKEVAYTIFDLIRSCIQYPDRLDSLCQHFSSLECTKGFQSGMLTPMLNALKPDLFLLINSKSSRTISYFTNSKCSPKLEDYPVVNRQGHQLIRELAPIINQIWNTSIDEPEKFQQQEIWQYPPNHVEQTVLWNFALGAADQFDMFCHWLVSIEKHPLLPAHYWKIAPGENAWQWQECYKQGFIGIGWDELGDISSLSHREFNNCRDRLIQEQIERGWKKAVVNQVWTFAQIKVGDRIVANRGTSEVLGIGTVTGAYYYDSNATNYKHRLSVKWVDINPLTVNFPGWRRTLVALNPTEFDAISQASSTGTLLTDRIDRDSIQPAQPEVHPQCPFTITTFDLLSKLHLNPKKSVYDAYKQDFNTELIVPFQTLMSSVAKRLPETIMTLMETETKVFARILKNDWGQGNAWDFYWGAFYPQGGKRVADAQLFLWINHERMEFGFYIGQYGSEQRQQFLNNCHQHQAALISLLEPSLKREDLILGGRENIAFDSQGKAFNRKGINFQDWLSTLDRADIHVASVRSKEQILHSSVDELATQIQQVYQQVFPLVLLAVKVEPMPSIIEYLDLDDANDEEIELTSILNEPYTLEQCAQTTQIDRIQLQDWTTTLDRKGQAIIYGPPGTGKTYLARCLAKHLIGGGDGFTETVQFHPAYTYEDFIQGIRPRKTDGGLDYPTVPGRFLEFCRKAKDRKTSCVLIIDEINRANLAQVFGELMYLIEYREEKIHLAGGETFSIPKNVRIIGTMNTAD
jgi:5-methylcytosine-specific restriction enzyme B